MRSCSCRKRRGLFFAKMIYVNDNCSGEICDNKLNNGDTYLEMMLELKCLETPAAFELSLFGSVGMIRHVSLKFRQIGKLFRTHRAGLAREEKWSLRGREFHGAVNAAATTGYAYGVCIYDGYQC